MSTTLILVIVIAILLLVAISVFNSLTNKKNQVTNAFGSVDVQLKNRYDLIPNLVATVQQYATHEKELLTKITDSALVYQLKKVIGGYFPANYRLVW